MFLFTLFVLVQIILQILKKLMFIFYYDYLNTNKKNNNNNNNFQINIIYDCLLHNMFRI